MQLAVSLALVAAGGLFVRASVKAASADIGFPLAHQLVVNLDPTVAGYKETETRGLYMRVLDRMRALAGVEDLALASTVPFGGMSEGRSVFLPGQNEGRHPEFDIVTAGYFDPLHLPFLRGRAFSSADDLPSAATRSAVVDVRLARMLFGEADPVGKSIEVPLHDTDKNRLAYTIVGVVPSVKHDILLSDRDERGHVYVPYGTLFRGRMSMHVRVAPTAGEAMMLSAVQRELHQIDPRLPVLLARSMTSHRDASFGEWSVRTGATLFSTFGGLALLLATIGIYGLKAYDVSRRTREIGIRMALGATGAQVLRLVLKEGLRTTAIALGVGLLLALGLGKLVSGLLYHVSPFDPAVLAIALVSLATATLVASYFPARYATRVVPLEALRSE
ncbi:MAG: FtsX-like permease family protein [Polyangiales bacterium]